MQQGSSAATSVTTARKRSGPGTIPPSSGKAALIPTLERSPTSMNSERILALAKHLRELAAQPKAERVVTFDMSSYMSVDYRCQTHLCIAGHAVFKFDPETYGRARVLAEHHGAG